MIQVTTVKQVTNAIFVLMTVLTLRIGPAIGQPSHSAGQAPVAPDDVRLMKLPAPLRDQGRLVLIEPDEDKRADLVEVLAEKDAVGALDFLLALLESDPSADVRENIVDELEEVDDPRVNPALERRVLVDSDLDIALAALELLRARSTRPLMRSARAAARQWSGRAGRTEAVGRLAARARSLDDNRARWAAADVLPDAARAFFVEAGGDCRSACSRSATSVTEAKPRSAWRRAMLRYHEQHAFDFAITLGDNFYPSGMDSPSDPRWESWWSALYDPLKIQFYAAFGNHDWNQPNGPAAEILFSQAQSELADAGCVLHLRSGTGAVFCAGYGHHLGGAAALAGRRAGQKPRHVEGGLRAPPDLLGGAARRQQSENRAAAAGAEGSG